MNELLGSVSVLPRRLLLETPGVQTTVPQLRGVWGAALHDLDRKAYEEVFDPPGVFRATGYLLRPAPPDPEWSPAVEYFLFGAAIERDALLMRAWDIASGMGLGPKRRRFYVRRIAGLAPDGRLQEEARAWSLDRAAWPLAGDPAATPCRLKFTAPLRLMRRKQLIREPNLADLVVAACRRLSLLGPLHLRPAWRDVQDRMLEAARQTPQTLWRGERLDLVRYSGRQRGEVTLHGVRGSLELPQGPGELWPLLAAGRWVHLGKGAPLGLGQLAIEPL